MNYTEQVRAEAESNIIDDSSWYESQQRNLGHEFLDNFSKTLEAIKDTPLFFPKVKGELSMQAAKQDALNTIEQLPDTADMEEIMYRLYVLDKVRKGQEDVEQGRLTPAEDLKHEIEQW